MCAYFYAKGVNVSPHMLKLCKGQKAPVSMFFRPAMGVRPGIQVIRLAWQMLLPSELSCWPKELSSRHCFQVTPRLGCCIHSVIDMENINPVRNYVDWEHTVTFGFY